MNRTRAQVLRMLALVPYLQGNDGIPVADVAREFGVPPRQIQEDLRLLMYTGVGEYAGELIDFDLGALEEDGVVHIRDAEFMTRPLRLSTSEGVALIVALRTLRASAGENELPIIDGALAKLESAVGDGGVEAPVDVHVGTADPAVQSTLQRAVTQGERVEIEYANASRDERTVRRIDPRRVFIENGQLYVEAWCLRAEDLRFFRLDRVLSARTTGERAEEHDGAPRDLSEGFFTPGDDTPSAILDLTPAAAWIQEYYEAQDLGTVTRPDGSVAQRVRLHGSDWTWLTRLALRHAGAVHVVEPVDLAARVAAEARAALDAYSG